MAINLASKFVDITARKPAGWLGTRLYRDPKGHYRSFDLALEKLQLKPGDAYLEIGCGGGVLLERALKVVSTAMAIDLSRDMVKLSRELNRQAIAQGRVTIVEGNAENLPWGDESFSCVASANMFFFVEAPEAVLGEVYRVLKPGGRLVIATQPKAPWFWIMGKLFSMHLYTGQEMESMMRTAGFSNVEARTVGILDQICYGEK